MAPDELIAGANTDVVRFVPHDDVFAHASLVVTHAGLGARSPGPSVGASRCCACRWGAAQFFNAGQVAVLGVGRVIDAGAEPAAIATAVSAVLGDEAVLAASHQPAGGLSDYGGTPDGVAELERLVQG